MWLRASAARRYAPRCRARLGRLPLRRDARSPMTMDRPLLRSAPPLARGVRRASLPQQAPHRLGQPAPEARQHPPRGLRPRHRARDRAPRRRSRRRHRRPHQPRAGERVRAGARAPRATTSASTRRASPSSPATTTSTRAGALTSRRFERYFGRLPDERSSRARGRHRRGALPGGEAPRRRGHRRRSPAPSRGRRSSPPGSSDARSSTRSPACSRTPRWRGARSSSLLHHPAVHAWSRLKTLRRGAARRPGAARRCFDAVPRGLLLHGHLHRRIQRIVTTDAQASSMQVGATSASLHHETRGPHGRLQRLRCRRRGDRRVEAHVYDPATDAFQRESVPKHV